VFLDDCSAGRWHLSCAGVLVLRSWLSCCRNNFDRRKSENVQFAMLIVIRPSCTFVAVGDLSCRFPVVS
jgi:hypothetical protein